jgi:hypothetical protein
MSVMPKVIKKSDLKEMFDNNSVSLKNRNIDKEVNNIKYQVLQRNNLGHKNYTYEYNYDSDNISINDYFQDILDKLITVFTDITITYTTDVSGSSSSSITYHNSTMSLIANPSRQKYSNITNKKVNNTITIDWS